MVALRVVVDPLLLEMVTMPAILVILGMPFPKHAMRTDNLPLNQPYRPIGGGVSALVRKVGLHFWH
jgi:hypothetical protein